MIIYYILASVILFVINAGLARVYNKKVKRDIDKIPVGLVALIAVLSIIPVIGNIVNFGCTAVLVILLISKDKDLDSPW